MFGANAIVKLQPSAFTINSVVSPLFHSMSGYRSASRNPRLPVLAEPDCILIVDGTFLQRHELSPQWDLVVSVEVSADVAANRGIARDSPTTAAAAVAARLYRERYLPAFEMYEAECEPIQNAGVIFRNEVLEQPALLTRRRDD